MHHFNLLSVIGKVFEKMLLFRLSDQQAKLNLLQGGFRANLRCLHCAFIFQEAVSSLTAGADEGDNHCVYMWPFLYVKKVSDTVWHARMKVKLFQNNVPLYIWHIINNWYSDSTSLALWNLSVSWSLHIQQGIYQGSFFFNDNFAIACMDSYHQSSTSIVQQMSPCKQLNSVTQSSSPSFTSVPNTMTLVQHSESSVLTESLSTPKTTLRSQSSA